MLHKQYKQFTQKDLKLNLFRKRFGAKGLLTSSANSGFVLGLSSRMSPALPKTRLISIRHIGYLI
jgi:hypothetical protein